MIEGYRIEGHAIVSADDRIADPAGNTPPELSNEADWLRFQRALEEASVIVLGRRSHETNPNSRRRNRLIVSGSAKGVERRPDGWWWNPTEIGPGEALAKAAPGGGTVAVPGGRLIFDLFRNYGFDSFHLARCEGVWVPGGVPLFTAVDVGLTAEAILAADGLEPGQPELIDPAPPVSLTIWRRADRAA